MFNGNTKQQKPNLFKFRLAILGVLRMKNLTLRTLATDLGMSYSDFYYRLYGATSLSEEMHEDISKSFYKLTGYTVSDALKFQDGGKQ